jgi:hypothetical protein
MPLDVVNSRMKKHHCHLLTDSLKQEEEGAMSPSGLMAMNCNHHIYGQSWRTSSTLDASRRI